MRMDRHYRVVTLAVLAAALPMSALAQPGMGLTDPQARFEFGAAVVGGFYDDRTLRSPDGTGEAGFKSGIGGSLWLGEDMYEHIGGELRYDYVKNQMRLAGMGEVTTFSGRSHAFHYDLHFNFAGRSAPVRPYLLVGGGLKYFVGTGALNANQPLQSMALFNRVSEMKPLFTIGAGLKFRLGDHVSMRLEFRDNMTAFPRKVITPTGSTVSGAWIHNFLPSIGLGYIF